MSRTTNEAGEARRKQPDRGSEGARFLDLVLALNERCLELLSRVSLIVPVCECRLSGLMDLHNPWRNLDRSVRQRLSRLPFVLVDIHFMDAGWWQSARVPTVRDSSLMPTQTCLRDELGASLTQETMMLAWHAVQLDRRAATWRIGMSRDVANVIWQLSTQDVLRIAALFPCEAQPRWGESGELWTRLVSAAGSNDEDAWQDAQRDAMLRLSGELLMARSDASA